MRRRRKRARDSQRAHARREVYRLVTERDHWRCRNPHCTTPFEGVQRDHLDPKKMGGDPTDVKTSTANVVLLCTRCHQQKTEHRLRVVKLTALGADGDLRFEYD